VTKSLARSVRSEHLIAVFKVKTLYPISICKVGPNLRANSKALLLISRRPIQRHRGSNDGFTRDGIDFQSASDLVQSLAHA
jgi:hypothetical protein